MIFNRSINSSFVSNALDIPIDTIASSELIRVNLYVKQWRNSESILIENVYRSDFTNGVPLRFHKIHHS